MGAATSASLALGAVQAGFSFHQASKNRKLEEKARADAAKFVAEAKRTMGVNYSRELGIAKEAYDLEREASLQSGAQILEGAREGDYRGVGAIAGRVQMAQNEMQGNIRAAMQKELTDRDRLIAAEDAHIRDRLSAIDLAEAEGAQVAATNAWAARQANLASGFSAITGMVGDIYEGSPLYEEGRANSPIGRAYHWMKGKAGMPAQRIRQRRSDADFVKRAQEASSWDFPQWMV